MKPTFRRSLLKRLIQPVFILCCCDFDIRLLSLLIIGMYKTGCNPSSMPIFVCWASQRRGHTWRTVLSTGAYRLPTLVGPRQWRVWEGWPIFQCSFSDSKGEHDTKGCTNNWKLKICKYFHMVGLTLSIIISRPWGSIHRLRDASNREPWFWNFIVF